MKIGIDARALSGRMTGDRTYWRGLLGGLSATDAENEYVLYTRRPVDGEPLKLGPNFRWRVLPSPAQDALWMLGMFPLALRADRIDVAHTQYNIPLLGCPCPVVTTVHDVSFRVHPEFFLPRDRWILNTLVPRSMQKAARVITDSDSTRRDIGRFCPGVPKDRVRVILLAADAPFVPPAAGQEIARQAVNTALTLDNRPYICAVGVLQPRKNLALLLDAFALLKLGPHPPPHRLLIVGKSGWLDETNAQIAALPPEAARDIVLTGYLADEFLPTLYGGADALCYPSRYEGFGLPPLEAMACGCPVLVSRSSSLPEVVGDAGILLPPDNSHAWAHALETLLGSPAVQERWRGRGPARAARFSWAQTARETLEVYRECLK